ncbi:hypothetical protein DQW77_14725 [Roseovarius sp. TE539]|uniref:hypothetical protein n=1 Tax=Roseovarius sp. TE539 TaxID=2249812 RepID=UPI000DDDFCA4|nr:hypothetical protein [Roseovarius sp. TE539]RBI69996.1 hypothetical protein DQW77_14725 [Roseovarius sp. TE539]
MRYDRMFREKGFHATLLTSFEFAPDVFDNVVYPGLRMGGSRSIGVIADQDRINSQFEEFDPPRLAGQTYHLAKRKVDRAFHSKIVLQLGQTRGRLIVGSSNLTSGGIAGNLEAICGLDIDRDQGWAAPLFAAALAYFRAHCAPDDRAMRRLLRRAVADVAWLRGVDPAREVTDPEGNRLAFLTEEAATGVGEQYAAFTQGDTIDRLVIVSPFWDKSLSAVVRLRESLGGPDLALVVDPDYHDLDPDAFMTLADASLHAITDLEDREERRLHAKLIIACGREADYVLTGSANASTAGLYGRRGGYGNAEACLARTEPAGTALERLGLSVCLSTQFVVEALSPPVPSPEKGSDDPPAPRDGGGLLLKQSRLTWSPPPGCAPADCRIRLEGRGGEFLEEIKPRQIGETWGADISCADAPPLRGRIRFSGTETSALVPVASIDRLAQASQSHSRRDYQKLLDAFREQHDLGTEMLDLALKIRSMHAAEHASRQEGMRHGSGGGGRGGGPSVESKPGTQLTEAEFNAIEDDLKAMEEEDVRFGPLGDTYRYINQILGLGLEIPAQEEEPDISTDLVSNNDDQVEDETDDETRETADTENDDRDRDQDDPNKPGNKQGQTNLAGPARPPPKRHAGANPAKLEKALEKHINALREELSEKALDPMDPGAAMILRLAILAIIADGAPVGRAPIPKYPVPALSTRSGDGWIRMLGRLLDAMNRAWPDGRFENEPPLPEQLDCMGAMIFGATLAHEAAAVVTTPGIASAHETLCAEITRRVTAAIGAHEEARSRLEEAMMRYGAARENAEARYEEISPAKRSGTES